MNRLKVLAAIAASALVAACVAPVGPVEVTRFHLPQVQDIVRGPITLAPALGKDGASIEYRTYATAVARELQRVGFTQVEIGEPGEVETPVAYLDVERGVFLPGGGRRPVSVGVGGSTGSYGSGVGLGVGIDLSGRSHEQVETRMSVVIRQHAQGPVLWEGRAAFAVSSRSPLAKTDLGAAKIAEALFHDFPGQSGETILVR